MPVRERVERLLPAMERAMEWLTGDADADQGLSQAAVRTFMVSVAPGGLLVPVTA